MITIVCKNLMYISIGIFFIIASTVIWKIPNEIISFRGHTFREIQQTREQTFTRIDTATNKLDKRINSIQRQLFKQLDNAEKDANNQLTQTNNTLKSVADNYNKIPNQLESRLEKIDPYLDCKNNAYCWQGLTTDTLRETRNTMQSVRQTANVVSTTLPEVEKNVDLTTKNFQEITANINKTLPVITQNSQEISKNINRLTQKHWYDRLLEVGVSGSAIYYNLYRSLLLTK